MNTALIAGMLAGVAGLVVFLVIHHFWIKPIWYILPPGLVIAVLGGLAAGWSYTEIKAGLPPRPMTALAVMALVGGTLAPAIVLAQLRPPPFDVNTGTLVAGSVTSLVARFVIELVLTATLAGGLAGWWLGRTGRAALATGLAGLLFALGPGHNIPFLGNTPAVGKGLFLLIIIVLVSSMALVEGQAWLAQR